MEKISKVGKNFETVFEEILTENNLTQEEVIYKTTEIKKGLFKSANVEVTIYKKSDIYDFVKEFLKEIVNNLGLEVTFETKKVEDRVVIKMYSNNNNILIGHNGNTIKALENLVRQKIQLETGMFFIISLDVENYKEKKLHTVETLMAIATYLIVVVEVLSIVFNYNLMPSNGRINGIFIGLCGDCVFLFAIICMKDSWRAGIPEKDQTKLVTNGIYKVSRNPAFLGFDLVYIGILVTYFNPVNLICTLFAIIMLHLQMLQEEKYMEATFGEQYLEYKKQVFRYFGRRNKK